VALSEAVGPTPASEGEAVRGNRCGINEINIGEKILWRKWRRVLWWCETSY